MQSPIHHTCDRDSARSLTLHLVATGWRRWFFVALAANQMRVFPPNAKNRSRSRKSKNERGIWQRRFWEHAIRDERDYRCHVDYIHFNPVKHGYVLKLVDWKPSSFHRFVKQGVYPLDWSGSGDGVQVYEMGEVE